MTHLGDRAAALVDGQLSADATERATMHLAGCRPCRDAVEVERLTKQRLAVLSGPELSEDFMRRLVEMAGPAGPLPPREERLHVVGAGAGAGSGSGAAARPLAEKSGRPVGVGTHPAGRPAAWGRRPGGTRPAGSTPARRTATLVRRPRLAVAVVAAACIVGAGVTVGGVAAAGATATGEKFVPAVDTFVAAHGATAAVLPFTDQSVLWGTVGARR